MALLVTLGPGCGSDAGSPPAPEPSGPVSGGTLVIALSSDMGGVNELVSGDTRVTQDVLHRLFLQLVEEQPDYSERPPSFAPRLASSWEWSEDRRALTFHLREAAWSDGRPITAEDVRWTWEAQRSPEVAWSYAEVKDDILDVEVVDPRTVRFHFSAVSASQLLDANEGVILPRHAWSALPFHRWRQEADWFLENLVVSGPFRLASWRRQQEIVLERNPRFHEPGLPRLDRVVFRILPEKSSQVGQLLAGAVDFVEHLPPEDAVRVQRSPGLELTAYRHRQYTYIVWNLERARFADAAVRRALTLAIDRQELVESLWHGYARVSTSPIVSSVWAHNQEIEPWPYDPEAARRLLAEAGWRDGDGDGILERDGEPFSFTLAANAASDSRTDAVLLIQGHLARVGIQVRPLFLEHNALVDRLFAHDFDAAVSGFTMDTSMDLGYAYHSESIHDGFNFGGYSSPEVDRLIQEVRAAADPEAMEPALDRIQEILHQEQPITFLWEPQRLNAHTARLRDARPNPQSTYFRLREWWLAPEGP